MDEKELERILKEKIKLAEVDLNLMDKEKDKAYIKGRIFAYKDILEEIKK